MNAERWKLIDDLLQSALELFPERRDDFLRHACADDPSMADEIKSLLSSHRRAGDFLQTPAMHIAAEAIASETERLSFSSLVGQIVSHYRILKPIGSGGMGSVWLAERCDGRFERKAAIKFIHLAAFDQAAAERFKREGAILGKVAHPHIAELIDAGLTEKGEPFLVLEYVDGMPIDAYCDQQKLGIDARIQLFLDVLSAVGHAHSNLIVHRDLKPSNILVSNDAQVKLLDFGIAKLLENETTPAQTTLEGGQVLTPRYAAPEQVTDGVITTATDIYALGVLLYLLLTGQHPAGAEPQLPAQLIKAIVEHEPQRASCAIAPADAEAAANRATTPDKLRRQLRSDLDTILGKALKKDSADRYPTASAFADDLRRYLRHEPISARPDTVSYRARKFLRRNRLAVSAVALALAAILLTSAIAIYQAYIARRRFEEVRKLAHTFVFDLHDEVAKLEGSTKAREMMVQTGLEYLDNLSQDAGRDLELKNEIAAAYMKIGDAQGYPTKPNLGHIADALASYQKAGDIYRNISDKDSVYLPDLANYYLRYAGLVRFTHDQQHAREMTQYAIQIFDRLHAHHAFSPNQASDYAQAWCTLGDMDEDMAHYHLAWTEFSTCRDIARAEISQKRDSKALVLLSQADERVGTAAAEVGLLSDALRALAEDESVLHELLIAEPQNPIYHRRLALVYHYRSETYYSDLSPDYGDPARALEAARLYLTAADAMVRSDPSNTSAQFSRAIAAYSVSFCLREFDPNGAVRLARDSVRMFDQMMATKPSYLVASRRVLALRRLGQAQLKLGQLSQARATAQLALNTERPIAAKDEAEGDAEDAELVQTLILAAEASTAIGEFAQAESYLSEARARAQKIAQSGDLTSFIPLANAERASSRLYTAWHRSRGADACNQELARLWQSVPGDNEYLERQRNSERQLSASLSNR